jgi:hypothetical protein
MRGTIVIAGSLAQKPGHGGHTWVFLQYLLGFRRLGWDVLFLDQLAPASCIDAAGRPCPPEEAPGLCHLRDVLGRFGLGEAFSVIYSRGERFLGLPRPQVLEQARNAAFLLNVMGFLGQEEVLAAARRRVFLDIDPGFGQMWRELGLSDPFRGHDDFVTIGEKVGRPGCEIPTCGLSWVTTPQPVVLEHWPVRSGTGEGAFTSVASWRGAYGPLEYGGKTYGLRVHEFRRFASLPRLTGERFHLALDIHPSDGKDLALLAEGGWSLVDPRTAAGDPWKYQDFVQRSRAEFMVAKNMYVQSRSGWFSDRSICYLASGKPVLAQDTGLEDLYPRDRGLLTFGTPDEAVARVGELAHDYARHARAARAIAEEYFDSDKVLARLLGKLGIA